MSEIFRRAGSPWRQARQDRFDSDGLKATAAIVACRNAVIGGQLCQRDECGREHPRHEFCGNRYCPRCQGATARCDMVTPLNEGRSANSGDTRTTGSITSCTSSLNEGRSTNSGDTILQDARLWQQTPRSTKAGEQTPATDPVGWCLPA